MPAKKSSDVLQPKTLILLGIFGLVAGIIFTFLFLAPFMFNWQQSSTQVPPYSEPDTYPINSEIKLSDLDSRLPSEVRWDGMTYVKGRSTPLPPSYYKTYRTLSAGIYNYYQTEGQPVLTFFVMSCKQPQTCISSRVAEVTREHPDRFFVTERNVLGQAVTRANYTDFSKNPPSTTLSYFFVLDDVLVGVERDVATGDELFVESVRALLAEQ